MSSLHEWILKFVKWKFKFGTFKAVKISILKNSGDVNFHFETFNIRKFVQKVQTFKEWNFLESLNAAIFKNSENLKVLKFDF